MSPEMLTLVAAVLAYDMARVMCEVLELRSSIADTGDTSPLIPGRRGPGESRSVMSCSRPENDIVSLIFSCSSLSISVRRDGVSSSVRRALRCCFGEYSPAIDNLGGVDAIRAPLHSRCGKPRPSESGPAVDALANHISIIPNSSHWKLTADINQFKE
jgi:hypothetical protein